MLEHHVSLQLSRAHYRDAWLYDRRYGRRKVDLPHYAALVGAHKGPWLELGAGTGRVTRALAAVCQRLTALEREPALVQRLRERLPQVKVIVGDFARVRLSERYAGIIAPFNTFSHVYGDLTPVLARLRMHLRPGGVLGFDVPLPQPSVLARDPDRFYRVGHATGSDGTRYRYCEAFEYDAATQQLLVTARYSAGRKTFVLPLLQRMHYPQELRLCAEAAGFTVLRHDGGFSREPLSAESESQVLVLRRR